MTYQLLYGVLWAFTIGIVTGIAKWWKDRKDNEHVQAVFSEIKDWAAIAVRAVKDLGDGDLEMTGTEKRDYAVKVLSDIRDKIGFDISDEQLELLIRHAYTVMMDEAKDDVYLIEGGNDGE